MKRISATITDDMYTQLVEMSIHDHHTIDAERPVLAPLVRKAVSQYLRRYGSVRAAQEDDGTFTHE